MKYRVKIETYSDDSKKYYPQYKTTWFDGWRSIDKEGNLMRFCSNLECSTGNEALLSVDMAKEKQNIKLLKTEINKL